MEPLQLDVRLHPAAARRRPQQDQGPDSARPLQLDALLMDPVQLDPVQLDALQLDRELQQVVAAPPAAPLA